MSDIAAKARGIRLERLRSMLEKDLGNPRAALEVLMSELRIGESQPMLWEQFHLAAIRNGKEAELADAYRKMAIDRRLKQLPPSTYAEFLMHAADFFQGVVGDGESAEGFLWNVLEVAPDQIEAFNRLEQKFEAANDELRLVELYAIVSRTPPKPPDEMAQRALKIVALLSAKTPLSDRACQGLLGLVPASAAILSALEAHCQKTNRIALACSLLEQAIVGHGLSEVKVVEQHRRLIDLYLGEANTPGSAISHVEELLQRDASDAQARAAAERLIPNRAVASRAAAALQRARRESRAPRS
jgi:hypothetical protein